MRKSWFLVLALAMITCAHKAPPLVKDRMKPKLQNIVALNNMQLQFTFSEDVDTLNLSADNFHITTGEDTLRIKTLYPSLSAAEIVAITELQIDTEYKVAGYVFDTAQNKGAFTGRFTGTSKPDTIAPWIIKYSKGTNQNQFYFYFSEAMDTTFFEFMIFPEKNIITQWRNLRVCYLVPADTINNFAFDTTYYIYINQGCRDLNGNFFGTIATNITPDTTFEFFILKGIAHISDTLVKTGLAVLKRNIPLGITLIDGGDFQFEVRDSLPYTVEVFSGEYSGSKILSPTDTLNIIDLKLEEKDFDNIFN